MKSISLINDLGQVFNKQDCKMLIKRNGLMYWDWSISDAIVTITGLIFESENSKQMYASLVKSRTLEPLDTFRLYLPEEQIEEIERRLL